LKSAGKEAHIHAFFRWRIDKGGRSALSPGKEPLIPTMPEAVWVLGPSCKLKENRMTP